jgi:iron only hydrogenase large subunit-like protein
MIEQQSFDKLLLRLRSSAPGLVVVSLSPQSVASLAGFLEMDYMCTFLAISQLLKNLNVHCVIDTSSAGDLTLMQTWSDLRSRLGASQAATGADKLTRHWVKPQLTSAVSSTRQRHHIPGEETAEENAPLPVLTNGPLPLLASQCPGFVCFAEKTTPEALPYLSSSKSAQQVLGSALKFLVAPAECGVTPEQVFHCSVQPCFDKKLESSRLDFRHDESTVRQLVGADSNGGSVVESVDEVDLVLSTSELWSLCAAVAAVTAVTPTLLPRCEEGIENKMLHAVDSSCKADDSATAKMLCAFAGPLSARPSESRQQSVESLFNSFTAEGSGLIRTASSGMVHTMSST